MAEEVYSYAKGPKQESVFLLDFPKAPEAWNQPDLAGRFEELLHVRTDVQKELELLRANKTIGASLEALVKITAEGKTFCPPLHGILAGLRRVLNSV